MNGVTYIDSGDNRLKLTMRRGEYRLITLQQNENLLFPVGPIQHLIVFDYKINRN